MSSILTIGTSFNDLDLPKGSWDDLAPVKVRRSPKTGFVYFIQARNTGLIKIGFTKDLGARFARLQADSGDRLDLRIHGKDATRQHERDLHEHFKDAHSHGEWFKPVPELLAAIEMLRASLTPEELKGYDAYKFAIY